MPKEPFSDIFGLQSVSYFLFHCFVFPDSFSVRGFLGLIAFTFSKVTFEIISDKSFECQTILI